MSEYIVDIGNAPQIGDTVETGEMMVRCRDCKHLAAFQHSPGTVYCGRLSSLYQVERDGFCSWGVQGSKQARGVRVDDTPNC